MKGIEEWFELYDQSHRHPVNVAIHKLAVPGIYLCALALLWSLPGRCRRRSTGPRWSPSRCWPSTCGCHLRCLWA